MTTTTGEPISVFVPTIAAERLYWHRLPPGSASRAEARAYACEPWLPVPLEEVHLIEASLADGGWLLVAVERSVMAEFLAAGDGDQASLIPDRIPPHCGMDTEEAATVLPRLELRVGDYAPAAWRDEQRRTRQMVARLLLTAVVLVIGACWYRIVVLSSAAQRLRAEQEQTIADAVHDIPGSASPAAKLVMALRQADAGRNALSARMQPEAWELLEGVVAAWPAPSSFHVEQISVDRSRCVIRGHAPTLVDCESVATALATAQVRSQPLLLRPAQLRQDASRVQGVILLERETR